MAGQEHGGRGNGKSIASLNETSYKHITLLLGYRHCQQINRVGMHPSAVAYGFCVSFDPGCGGWRAMFVV